MRKTYNYLKLNQEYIYRSLMFIIGILFAAFGMTLLIKSNLGQSTISGISNNIGVIINMKTGTVLAIINYICFAGQIILLKHNFKPIQILQLIAASLLGYLVNLFLYDVEAIANLQLNNYGLKLIFLFIGIIFMAYGVSLMIVSYTLMFGPLANIFIKSIKELKLKIYKNCIN